MSNINERIKVLSNFDITAAAAKGRSKASGKGGASFGAPNSQKDEKDEKEHNFHKKSMEMHRAMHRHYDNAPRDLEQSSNVHQAYHKAMADHHEDKALEIENDNPNLEHLNISTPYTFNTRAKGRRGKVRGD